MEETIEQKAEAYDKLKELLNRGYAIRLTQQKTSSCWGIEAAISVGSFKKQVVSRDGADDTLLQALEKVESTLAGWQIQKIREEIGGYSVDDMQEGLDLINHLQTIADRGRAIENIHQFG